MGDVRILPTAKAAMAFRLLVRAQELKVTDPAVPPASEEVIRILINKFLSVTRLRILRRLLLRTINEEELRDG